MTNKNPQANDADYIDSVISFYIQLPDTPVKPSQADRRAAAVLLNQGVTFHTVETALLLASVRRLARPDGAEPLPPIRSLAYFVPVIREISNSPLPDGYQHYLHGKLRRLSQA